MGIQFATIWVGQWVYRWHFWPIGGKISVMIPLKRPYKAGLAFQVGTFLIFQIGPLFSPFLGLFRFAFFNPPILGAGGSLGWVAL